MLGTAPSGSVQLQDYCVRPEKIGEPFFKSLSAFASDPRRRANAPVNTYSALSFRNLAPQHFWDGLMTGRNLSPHSHGSSAACQALSQIYQRSLCKPFHQNCHGQLLCAGWWSTATALHLVLFRRCIGPGADEIVIILSGVSGIGKVCPKIACIIVCVHNHMCIILAVEVFCFGVCMPNSCLYI